MPPSNYLNDLRGVLRGLESVLQAACKYQQSQCSRLWENSSVKSLVNDTANDISNKLQGIQPQDVNRAIIESFERSSVVLQGIKSFATQSAPAAKLAKADAQQIVTNGVSDDDLKAFELNRKDKELIDRLEKEYELKLKAEAEKGKTGKEIKTVETEIPFIKKIISEEETTSIPKKKEETSLKKNDTNKAQPSVKKFEPKRQTLNPVAKQRRVPSSRISRMVSFGSLAAGLGLGTVAEVTRRTLGISGTQKQKGEGNQTLDQLFLTEANAERIVQTLCKVRGAALKIGQILSLQDSNLISPELQKAFERVRQSADFMPTYQVLKVLIAELGVNWNSKVQEFEEKPFAAASIGQVHHIRLLDGREAAMKIQYPGVADGIESDINNLVGVLKIWNIFPEGLFIDNLVEVAKRELAWEVDYRREAECTKKFKKLLEPYTDYVVPDVIDELSTQYIFTTTLIEGIPVDQCCDLDDDHKEHLSKLVMQLCLRELFEFRYMQTDPNWANFFYNPITRKLGLLDFGASRSYEKKFIDKYIEIIKAASDKNREKVLKLSQDMGFLTGYESKTMEDAHVDAVMILAEVFSAEKPFDFGRQDTTLRIHKLVPTIVAQRLCPPPEEIYSLHRKLSGVFLLYAKLKVKISCREMFLNMYEKYHNSSQTEVNEPSSKTT